MAHKAERIAFLPNFGRSQTQWRLGLFIFLLVGFFLADFFPNELNVSRIQAWYPAAGVSLIIGVLFGWQSWIFVFLTSLLSHYVQGHAIVGAFDLLIEAILTAVMTVPPYFILKRLKVDIFLESTKDLSIFIFTTIFISILVSVLQISVLVREDAYQYISYWTYALYFSLQNIIGILSIYPFALILIGQIENAFTKPNSPRRISFSHFERNNHPLWYSIGEFGFVLTILVIIIIIIFKVPSLKILNTYYLVFIPLIWLALRFSRFGALVGVIIVTAGIMTAVRGDYPSLVDILSMQLFLLIQITITLLTGHFVSERKRIITRLEEGERRFRAVANTVPAGIFQINPKGEIFYLANRWTEFTGYTIEESLGKPIISFVYKDDKTGLKEKFLEVSKKGTNVSDQFRFVKSDGDLIWVQCNLSSFIENIEGFTGVLGAFFDINEIKETERNLTSSEMLFRSFIDNLPDPAWMKSIDGRYLATNQANCELHGLKFKELFNKTDEEIWGKDKASEFTLSDRYVIDNKLPVRFENEILDAGKNLVWHEVVKTPLIKNGQVIGTTGIARDITDRKKVEMALLDSEHRMKAILNNIPDLAWLKDTQDRFIAVNDVFCSTYDLQKDEVIGKKTTDLFPPEIADQFLRDDQEVLGLGRPKVVEEEIPNKAGYLSWYETIKMPIYDDNKNIVGITGIAREITIRKRAEQSLQNRLSIEKLVTSIAARLNQLQPDSTERDILSALEDAGTFLQADRCTCIVLDEYFVTTDLQFQWRKPGIPEREMLVTRTKWQSYEWLRKTIMNKDVIRCTRISDLPANASNEVEFWLQNGIISMLGIPFSASDKGIKAFMMAETVAQEKVWTDDDEQFLRLVGEMMMTTISRLTSERKLSQAEHSYRLLAEQIAAVVYIEAPENGGRITYISPQVEELLGYSPAELMSQDIKWEKIIHPLDRKRVMAREKSSLRSKSEFREEYRLITKSGKTIWIEDQMSFLKDEGIRGIWHGVIYDITNRKMIEEALTNSKARYQELFDHSPISLWEEDFSFIKKRLEVLKRKSKGQLREYLHVNPQEVSRLLGLLKVIHVNQTTLALMNVDSFTELTTLQNPSFNLKPTDLFIEEVINVAEGKTKFEVEAPNDFRDGVIRYHNLHFMAVPGFETTLERVIIAITDVTDRKITEEKLTYMSTHDSLTGLFSRSYFEAELERLQVSRHYPISILMADVDHLKITNDTEGHASGDRLIKRAAHVLRLSFRPEDVIARIGGDEFVVITPDTDRFTAAKLLQRLRGMLELENKNKTEPKILDLSMGVATAETGDLLSDVLKTADYQMYQDKESKKKLKASAIKRTRKQNPDIANQ